VTDDSAWLLIQLNNVVYSWHNQRSLGSACIYYSSITATDVNSQVHSGFMVLQYCVTVLSSQYNDSYKVVLAIMVCKASSTLRRLAGNGDYRQKDCTEISFGRIWQTLNNNFTKSKE